MLLNSRRLLAPALVLTWLIAAGPAMALTPEVKDQAGAISSVNTELTC
jgi:hypothetical protein